jgi:hypothetical protein
VPGTWLLDWLKKRKGGRDASRTGESGYQG